jgi:4-amino-4-deoxychorismate lyase
MKPPADVPFDAPAVERGVGFFETVLLVGRRAVLWDKHLDRLMGTLLRFELPRPLGSEIDRAARLAVNDSGAESSDEKALRVTWIATAQDLDRVGSWRLDVTVREIPKLTMWRRNGSNAITLSPELARDTPSVKSTSYFAAIAGLRFARKRGGDEGLFIAPGGTYLEGTSTSLIAWNGGSPFLPYHGALPSITAAAFLEKRVSVVPLTAEAIRAGALLAGSLTMVTPVLSLDGSPCAQPAAMIERIKDFNRKLLTEPAFSHGF